MAATIEELRRRVETVEAEMKRLARLVEDPEQERPPTDGTLDEWLARLRAKKGTGMSLEEMQRALDIPPGMPRTGAKALREMMLAEGVRPEERLASSGIARMREE